MGDFEQTNSEIRIEFAVGRSDDEFEGDGVTALVTRGEDLAGEQSHLVSQTMIAVDGAINTALVDAFTDVKNT